MAFTYHKRKIWKATVLAREPTLHWKLSRVPRPFVNSLYRDTIALAKSHPPARITKDIHSITHPELAAETAASWNDVGKQGPALSTEYERKNQTVGWLPGRYSGSPHPQNPSRFPNLALTHISFLQKQELLEMPFSFPHTTHLGVSKEASDSHSIPLTLVIWNFEDLLFSKI